MNTFSSEVKRIAVRYFDGLATPFSESVKQLMLNEDWEGLQQLSVNPRSYTDGQLYMRDACAAGFLKKYQGFPTDPDRRRARAMAKWEEGERQCYRSNQRLCRYLPDHQYQFDDPAEPHVRELFDCARKIIRSWIGSQPDNLVRGRFGPGATYSDAGETSTVLHKIGSNSPSITHDAIWHLPQWLGTQWGRSFARRRREINTVPGNRVLTVPKTSWIDRVIAAEPAINVFYQLGYGRMLRDRLRNRAGWNLKVAQERHRLVAEAASVSKLYFTEDLSNASDTICKVLVRILLPSMWFTALDDLRSKKSLVDGRWRVLEKFSSMGNGFTFELETIIFASLVCATIQLNGGVGKLGVDVFVYGDDIIAPEPYHRAVRSVLGFCGFTSNPEKSFFGQDRFRESCGGDYFDGFPVRPHFLKEPPTEPQDYIVLHNGLRRVMTQLENLSWSLPGRILASVTDNIPTRIRQVYGPPELGDIVLHGSQDHWSIKVRSSIRYIRCYKPLKGKVTYFERFDADVVLACATYGITSTYTRHPRSTEKFRYGIVGRAREKLGHRVGWTPFS